MYSSRKRRWLDGRFANVDGIPFQLPVGTAGSPALMAAFDVDPDAAQGLLPGEELHAYRLKSRGLLVILVVDYLDTVIGRYVEFCIGVLCTRGRRPVRGAAPIVLPPVFGTGAYVYDLAVSTEISVKGGLGIWGMPKRQANLDFLVTDEFVSSQYDLDGRLVMRIDVPRPRHTVLPVRLRSVSYGSFRGMLTKSEVSVSGSGGVGSGTARLLFGDHPRADPLKALDVNPSPLFTAYFPRMTGVLDDHVETWFLSEATPPPSPATGLRDVVDLGLSQEWLAPPDRDRTDHMLAEQSPRPDRDRSSPTSSARAAGGRS